jgi:ribosomal 50S subunit-recycling heat shock protein
MATIQVAETLELRRTLARQLLVDTLWQQAAAGGADRRRGGVGGAARHAAGARAQRPAARRAEDDLSPGARRRRAARAAARDRRHQHRHGPPGRLLDHQKRFVRDASHQLRTPLAVLKAQVQSARRGDVDAAAGAGRDRHHRRPRHRAGQPDAGAGQGRAAAPAGRSAGGRLGTGAARGGAGPGAADRRTPARLRPRDRPGPVRAHEWSLRELVRNLLHNAIKHTPPGGPLAIALQRDGPGRAAPCATAARASATTSASACSSPSPPATRAAARAWAWPSAWRSCAPPAADRAGQPPVERAGGRAGRVGAPAAGRQSALMPKPPPTRAPGQVAVGGALLYKTRSLAAEEIGKGRSRSTARPPRPRANCARRPAGGAPGPCWNATLVVLGLSHVRGPAPVAQLLYEETPRARPAREKAAGRAPPGRGAGRQPAAGPPHQARPAPAGRLEPLERQRRRPDRAEPAGRRLEAGRTMTLLKSRALPQLLARTVPTPVLRHLP